MQCFLRLVLMTKSKLYFMFTKPFLCLSWQILTLAAFHEDVTCNVSSHAPDNKTFVIKYYLLYSNRFMKSCVVPFLENEPGLMIQIWVLLVLFHCIMK